MSKKKNITTENQLITYSDPRSPITEAYRTLRTNIQFSGLDKEIKTILVTGATPECGKSTTTANLGVIMAQAGTRVLLADADLRKPTLQKIFSIDNNRGLTHLLINEDLSFERFISRTQVENLHILTSGHIPPNPAELLGSARMRNIVKILSGAYDVIIFDSPPILAVTDASLIARMVDATIIVLDYARVTRDQAILARDQLHKVQANIIGTIINGMRMKEMGSHYYYYYSRDVPEPKKRGANIKSAGSSA